MVRPIGKKWINGKKQRSKKTGIVDVVISDTSFMTMIKYPEVENYYVWREFAIVEGEDEPRLLVPWSDPQLYEDSFDFLFSSIEEAIAVKEEDSEASIEDWILCRLTLHPIDWKNR